MHSPNTAFKETVCAKTLRLIFSTCVHMQTQETRIRNYQKVRCVCVWGKGGGGLGKRISVIKENFFFKHEFKHQNMLQVKTHTFVLMQKQNKTNLQVSLFSHTNILSHSPPPTLTQFIHSCIHTCTCTPFPPPTDLSPCSDRKL